MIKPVNSSNDYKSWSVFSKTQTISRRDLKGQVTVDRAGEWDSAEINCSYLFAEQFPDILSKC